MGMVVESGRVSVIEREEILQQVLSTDQLAIAELSKHQQKMR